MFTLREHDSAMRHRLRTKAAHAAKSQGYPNHAQAWMQASKGAPSHRGVKERIPGSGQPYDGKLEVETFGVGSTFTVKLPLG